MHISIAPRRLVGRIAFLIIGIALAQFAVTILLYNRISEASVREDHARRVAELLEVSERLHSRGEQNLSRIMSTKHLQVWLTAQPAVQRASSESAARQIKALVGEWEPELVPAPLNMDVEHRKGRDHLIGSMRLDDATWLNFRSTNLSSPWPIIASATLITLILTGLIVLFAALALRQLGAPLRHLAEATNDIGHGKKVMLAEEGPSDLRNLSRAFNAMQDRIAQILSDQTSAFVAISHDLRTPLARLKLGSDLIEEEDVRDIVGANVAEMEAMIASLQLFLKVQDVADRLTKVDPVQVVQEAGLRWREQVRIGRNGAGASVVTYPTVLRLALEPLIENAVQYGGQADIAIERDGASLVVRISDNGPGLADEHLPELIKPFFRADAARARNTAGFGLGIPRAHRLLQRFGGTLSFSRRAGGGLEVRVCLPMN